MTGVLDMPADELLAVLEEQAAGGNQRAARVLEDLLAEEAADGRALPARQAFRDAAH